MDHCRYDIRPGITSPIRRTHLEEGKKKKRTGLKAEMSDDNLNCTYMHNAPIVYPNHTIAYITQTFPTLIRKFIPHIMIP